MKSFCWHCTTQQRRFQWKNRILWCILNKKLTLWKRGTAMHVMDLTQTIGETMPVYPGTEQPKLTQTNTIERMALRRRSSVCIPIPARIWMRPHTFSPALRRWMHCLLKNSRERHALWTAPMRERADGLRCGTFKTCARRRMKRNSCCFIRAGAAFGTMDATLARTLRLMRM